MRAPSELLYPRDVEPLDEADRQPMTGTPLIAGWIAQIAFWTLLGVGFFSRELGGRSVAAFVTFWLLGYFGLPHVGPTGGFFVTPYVGILDIVLAFAVFKGDVRLT